MSHLPNLLVIGAMKAATTSLHSYLDSHPDVAMSAQKELNYFVPYVHRAKDEAWYRSHFPAGAPVRGESSPSYTCHPFVAGVPELAAAQIPDARLIYLVRDPVERLRSQYVHLVAGHFERRTFGEVVASLEEDLVDEAPEPSSLDAVKGYLARSMYHRQITRWLRCFPPERLLVVTQERLQRDRDATLASIFAFLGVDPDFRSERFEERRNTSADKRRVSPVGALVRRSPAPHVVRRMPAAVREPLMRSFVRVVDSPVRPPDIPPAERARIDELLQPDVDALRRETGDAFGEWSL